MGGSSSTTSTRTASGAIWGPVIPPSCRCRLRGTWETAERRLSDPGRPDGQASSSSSRVTLSRSSTAVVARVMPPWPTSSVCQRLPIAAVDVAEFHA